MVSYGAANADYVQSSESVFFVVGCAELESIFMQH